VKRIFANIALYCWLVFSPRILLGSIRRYLAILEACKKTERATDGIAQHSCKEETVEAKRETMTQPMDVAEKLREALRPLGFEIFGFELRGENIALELREPISLEWAMPEWDSRHRRFSPSRPQ